MPTNEDEINRIVEVRIPKKIREKVAWVWRIFDQWYELWRIRTDSLKVWKEYNEWQKSDLNHCLI